MEEKKTKRSGTRSKLGEMLVKNSIITEQQMNAALHMQENVGGRLGRNLIELNYISEDILIGFLSSQLGMDDMNLNKAEIPPDVQRLVPLDLVRKFGVLPLKKIENSLYLGMTDPTDLDSIKELEFILGLKIVPLALAESQWEFALRFFRDRGWGEYTLTKRVQLKKELGPQYDLKRLIKDLIEHKGSDLHLSVGVQPTFRIGDQMVRLKALPLTPEKMNDLLFPILNPQQREYLSTHDELDFAMSFDGIGRFRFNIYRQKNNLAAALRHIIEDIPSLEDLVLPGWLANYIAKEQGLILITGPSGHGKSTTMACLIDIINITRAVNVVTIEDPIEYVHYHKRSNVNQREIGTDTASFQNGMKYIFRQDPDVIAIGEMRDLESIATALTAAETGHLVLATLHTLGALSTIDRIIDVFPSHQQNQVRNQLASSLLLVFSQRLVPRADGSGRILAYEKLSNSYRVQNLIRENRTHQVKSQSAMASEDYSPLDYRLAELARKGLITYGEGLKFSEDRKTYQSLVKK